MPAQKLKKSLPKRCMNERLKARRLASWKRGEERKEARRKAQAKREQANKMARAAGELTAHELKENARKARREGLSPQPRTPVGNILVDITVRDEHGSVTIKGVKPCCNAKSYFHCDHNPKARVGDPEKLLTRGRFYKELAENNKLRVR
jgi:hypothetical protein